jgi:hypothetical protein
MWLELGKSTNQPKTHGREGETGWMDLDQVLQPLRDRKFFDFLFEKSMCNFFKSIVREK